MVPLAIRIIVASWRMTVIILISQISHVLQPWGRRMEFTFPNHFYFLPITIPKIVAELKYIIIILGMIRDGGLNWDLLVDDT